MYFQELAVVNYMADNVIHVVRLVRIVRDDIVQLVIHTVDRVVGRNDRGLLKIVLRKIRKQILYGLDSDFLIVNCKVSHTGLAGVNACSTESFLCNVLTENALYNLRSGKEHVAALGHDVEVSKGRRINRTTGARAENG